MSPDFTTTYNQHYRIRQGERRLLLAPHDRFTEILPEGGNWLIVKTLEEKKKSGELNVDEVEKRVQAMIRERYWSVYQVDYCKNQIPKKDDDNELTGDDDGYSYYRLFRGLQLPVFPPRQTARRLFGYMKPRHAHMPLTVYDATHGMLGYKVLQMNR